MKEMAVFRDEDFMRMALEKAREGGANGQAPFAACIVKDGVVVACEHNAVWRETDSTLHAEVHAIRVAERKLRTIDLTGSTIYSHDRTLPHVFCRNSLGEDRSDRVREFHSGCKKVGILRTDHIQRADEGDRRLPGENCLRGFTVRSRSTLLPVGRCQSGTALLSCHPYRLGSDREFWDSLSRLARL